MTWHGLLQVFGQGRGTRDRRHRRLGHILLTIGIGCLLACLDKPLRTRLTATKEN
ncbi:MAG: hypothetical protein R2742_00595 [Micropruina glycogenica]